MADAIEIILSAVDSASEVFQSIVSSAQGMADGINSSVEEASSEFDTITENVANFNDSVANVDTSTLEELASELGMDTKEVERLLAAGADIGSLSAGFNEASVAADELEQEIKEDADAMEQLGSAGDVMATQTFMDMANGMKDSMLGMADSAGTFNDSIMRASLEAEGFGISADDMKSTISDLSDVTGRAGGQIRESFIKATARGVTDMDSFRTMMEGAGAQATLLGTDIQTMGDKFSSMAQKDTLMARTLAETGITMQELGTAMGMTGATADEVKAKWKELDTNQRAAILGTAASMNEGKNANDTYKHSWAGLQEQVNIAKGRLERLVGSVILPTLIPAMQLAGIILNGVGDVIQGVMNGPLGGLVSIIGSLAGAFMIGVTGAAALKNILGFLKIEAMLTTIETTALAFAEELQATGSISSAAANAIGAGGFGTLATAAWAAATAVWAALAPLLPYIAVAAAIAIAIYEIGKAFGWWTDVGSMIDAIGAGLQRLWNAFINHPDVQAVIQAISNAWDTLTSAIGEAWNGLMEFLGIATGGEFDIVGTLIHNIGQSWNNTKMVISTVINIVQTIINLFQQLGSIDPLGKILEGWNMLRSYINGVVSSILNFIGIHVGGDFDIISVYLDTVRGLWEALQPAIQAVVDIVSTVVSSFQAVLTGQMDIQTAVLNIWNSLSVNLPVIFNIVGGVVLQFASLIGQYALSIGARFVSNIISYISSLPGRFYTYLMNVRARILVAMALWITVAKVRAQLMVTGILNYIRTLPSRIYTYLHQVVSRIISAGAQWISNARSKAQSTVQGAYNAFAQLPGKAASALAGVVEAVVKPFRDAYNGAKAQWDKIANLASNIPVIGGAFGGDLPEDTVSAYGGDVKLSRDETTIVTGKEDMEINGDINLILDLINVPAHIDTATLIKMLTDKTVLQELVNNRDFQSLDAKVKERINLRLKRAQGV